VRKPHKRGTYKAVQKVEIMAPKEDYEYQSLLTRVREKLPESASTRERFQIPEPDMLYEGKQTILKNFGDIADIMNREPNQILTYLLREVGTAGNLDGRRIVFKGRVPLKQLQDRLNGYVETYILCSECRRPDTKLEKEGRTLVLKCEACGAHRPIRARQGHKTESKAPTLEEGKEYEVLIQDIGRKGDGIARHDKYIIYVPGVEKGAAAKVKIEKITGTIAFAHRV
jgi:translation initiation factor 2 subunit 2